MVQELPVFERRGWAALAAERYRPLTSDHPASGRVVAEARFQEVDATFLLDLRGWLSEPLRGWGPQLVREAAVVLGELMTNAFRHARPPFAARVTVPPLGRVMRVEVQDGSASPTSGWALGRGLLVVRDLCTDWGVEHRPDGKVAWAEVPAPRVTDEGAGPA